MNQRPIALVGATASGKSGLALDLARQLTDVELVSVDSMQVYRGMDIGTAKPTMAEREEIVHHGLDLVDPDAEFSLADFVAATRASIADIDSRGKRALLVGGTGLYLRAIVDELDLPGQFPSVRETFAGEPTAVLFARLQSLDAVAASRMEPDNRRRIERALEVTVGSGRPFSSYGPGLDTYPDSPFLMLGIWLPREIGRQRINDRVEQMMTDGLVAEVADLRAQFDLSKTARQALGYKQVLEALDDVEFSGLVDEIKGSTRSFARRQRVWFRRDPRIKWFGTAADPGALLPALLEECKS